MESVYPFSPLLSQPFTGEFVFVLVSSAVTNGEFERGVGVFPVGHADPPEHFHPIYNEPFDIVQSDLVFVVDGKEQRANVGDQLLMPKGVSLRR